MARSIQIASVFTAIGFKVNKKDLDKLQKQLGNLKKQIKVLAKASQININVNNPELVAAKNTLQGINRELAKVQSKSIKINVRRTGAAARTGGGGRGGFLGGALGSQAGQFVPGVGIGGALAFGGASIVKAAQQMENIRNAFRAVTENATEANKELKFTTELAQVLGINFQATASTYTRFLASAKSVNFSVEESQGIFAATAAAGRTLGLGTDDMNGIMKAMTQILSKGTVQAEELRGQLGDRLPGAVGLMSKALGVTVQQLNKMLEQGEIISADALPKLRKELLNFANANDALTEAVKSNLSWQERLATAWFFFKVNIAETGFMDKVTDSFVELTLALTDNNSLAKAISQAYSLILDIVLAVTKAVIFLAKGFGDIGILFPIIIGLSFILGQRLKIILLVVTLLLPVIVDVIELFKGWEGVIVLVIGSFIILKNTINALALAGIGKQMGAVTLATSLWAGAVNGVTTAIKLLRIAMIALGRTRAFIALGVILGLFAGAGIGLGLLPDEPQVPVTERGPDRTGTRGGGTRGNVTNITNNVDMVNNIETSQAAEEVNDQINALINGNMLPEA